MGHAPRSGDWGGESASADGVAVCGPTKAAKLSASLPAAPAHAARGRLAGIGAAAGLCLAAHAAARGRASVVGSRT